MSPEHDLAAAVDAAFREPAEMTAVECGVALLALAKRVEHQAHLLELVAEDIHDGVDRSIVEHVLGGVDQELAADALLVHAVSGRAPAGPPTDRALLLHADITRLQRTAAEVRHTIPAAADG